MKSLGRSTRWDDLQDTKEDTMTQKKFKLEIHQPYSTFTDGKPTVIPYVIDGLLPKAAFSVLGAKPKHGKSSFARIEAVSVAKGQTFLDRPTTQGEVLLADLLYVVT